MYPWICGLIVYRYFSTSSALSLSAWSAEGSETLSKCAHCDNCTRSPESVDNKDVTLDAWKILKVAHVIGEEGGRTTLGMLADLVRGAGGGTFEGGSGGRGKGKGKAKEKKPLDLDLICGGKVDMSKEVSLVQPANFQSIPTRGFSGCRKPLDHPTPPGLYEGGVFEYSIHH
jgi:hypothetical protein